MLCIINKYTDPYFNLAAEEYAFNMLNEDIFILWRNSPAVIIGKFQNAIAEINLDYVKENKIAVVRRMSGGGAVFHDLGNLNYTFIQNNSKGTFQSFSKPILEVLQKLKVNAQFEGRNDLTIDGIKFSGNAQYIHNKKILHHGTLLFSSQMTNLSEALKVNPIKFTDKAVKSVRKRVTNISEHLKSPITVEEFCDLIMKHIMQNNADAVSYDFTEEDITAINKLKKNKYNTWEWNFGRSPQYSFKKMIHTQGGNIEIALNIENGIITSMKLYGDFFANQDQEIEKLEKLFENQQYSEANILRILNRINIEEYIYKITNLDFFKLMI